MPTLTISLTEFKCKINSWVWGVKHLLRAEDDAYADIYNINQEL